MRKIFNCFIVTLFGVVFPSLLFAGMVEIAVLSDTQTRLPLYTTGSSDPNTYRAYVEAERGMRYSIRVWNNSSVRIGVVIAVDGRNIISGAKSNLAREERMYILNPRSSGNYEGWRTSSTQVNRFYFTDAPDSYSGAWGDYSAMGVIAVAVFPEQRPPQILYERRDNKEMEKSRPASPRMAAPGTGFGEGVYSPSMRVEFEPEAFPAERYFFKYEWRDTLCRKGIIDCRQPRNRFWNEREDYAPYPPPRPRPHRY